ncbi:hypothetical protein J7K18_01710 [bacterium]|nr:hypothetical protein [bacterium]
MIRKRTNKKKPEEEQIQGVSFKKRLVPLRHSPRFYTMLEKQGIAFCGYCGQRIMPYACKFIGNSDTNIPVYYSCAVRCERSGIFSSSFIDRTIIKAISKRLKKNFPDDELPYVTPLDIEDVTSRLEELYEKKVTLSYQLPYVTSRFKDVVEELKQLDVLIEETREELERFDSVRVDKNPYLRFLWYITEGEIKSLGLFVRREIARSLIVNARFFSDYIILKLKPAASDAEGKPGEMGRIISINLRYDI